jgi:hypothetical protein
VLNRNGIEEITKLANQASSEQAAEERLALMIGRLNIGSLEKSGTLKQASRRKWKSGHAPISRHRTEPVAELTATRNDQAPTPESVLFVELREIGKVEP